MKRRSLRLIPWIITCIALYLAFRSADWETLILHIKEADRKYLLLAICSTLFSYVFRSRRWQFLFSENVITFADSVRVLVLGFFMNNVLPARAGELVRAHFGARVTGKTRTLVLATIASERLADGLTLSIFFVVFAFGFGNPERSTELLYVSYLFGLVALGVALVLVFRNKIFKVLETLSSRFSGRASHFLLKRVRIFIDGLAPLFSAKRAPLLVLWSVVIWLVELSVFAAVMFAFNQPFDLHYCVLFLVTVNFSSLIPAAPGGIGVIEAVTAAVLISVGTPREIALAMVITQHVIQYAVIGISGAAIMLTWKGRAGSLRGLRQMEGAGIVE